MSKIIQKERFGKIFYKIWLTNWLETVQNMQTFQPFWPWQFWEKLGYQGLDPEASGKNNGSGREIFKKIVWSWVKMKSLFS